MHHIQYTYTNVYLHVTPSFDHITVHFQSSSIIIQKLFEYAPAY